MGNGFKKTGPIRFAQILETSEIYRPPGYMILSEGRPNWKFGRRAKHWLARKMWSWLKRSGFLLPYQTDNKIYEYGEPEMIKCGEAFSNQIGNMLYEVVVKGAKIEDYCLVLGGVQFHEISRYIGPDMQILTFPAQEVRFNHRGYRSSWRGIPIHVVPWMDGAVILPKVMVERESSET